MKWFQAGEDLTFDIDLLADGIPVTPDGGTVKFTVRDQAGAVIAGLDQQPLTVQGTTASILVPAGANAIGADTESRFVSVSFIADGASRQQQRAYCLHPFIPLATDENAVRSLLGVSADELPDDDIELVDAYYALLVGNPAVGAALPTTGIKRQMANRAIALRAALDALPSLQLRVFQNRTVENSTFGRFQNVSFAQLRADLTDELSAALNAVPDVATAASLPTLLVVSSPTDPVTNS
jgi:hypothetical protein